MQRQRPLLPVQRQRWNVAVHHDRVRPASRQTRVNAAEMTSRRYRIGPWVLFMTNLAMVWLYLWLILRGERDLWLLAASLSVLITALQTPLLIRAQGVLSRLIVLYGSMLLFLFCFGAGLSWEATVGAQPAGSWAARLDGGLRTALLGQVFAVPGYLAVALVNISLLQRASVQGPAA